MPKEETSLKAKKKLYFLALLPDDTIIKDVTKIKEYFAQQYHSKAALKSPPHITLFPPFYFPVSEEKELIRISDKFCCTQSPFLVDLQNFKAFPPRVIFVNILPNESLNIFHADLGNCFEKNLGLKNESRKGRPFAPHITVAFSDLSKTNFHLAWKEFKTKTFSASFLAQAITILKHNGKFWDIWHQSPLKSLPAGEI